MDVFLDDDRFIQDYKRFRGVQRGLNSTLTKSLPKTAIMECAKKLGIVRGKTLVLGNEDGLSVLFDYCLYYFRSGGKNTVERYYEKSVSQDSPDEIIVLRAIIESHYSLFELQSVHQAQSAVTLVDILHGQSLLLMDISLAKTQHPRCYLQVGFCHLKTSG